METTGKSSRMVKENPIERKRNNEYPKCIRPECVHINQSMFIPFIKDGSHVTKR